MPERHGRGCVSHAGLGVVPQPRVLAGDIQEELMLKQQVVSTSMGQLTVSSLTLGDLRLMEAIFAKSTEEPPKGLTSLLKYIPVISSSLRKVHQDLSVDQLENGITLEDFNLLLTAVLEVSGLAKASPGEQVPVPA
jgi:hypothetical protein